MVAIVTDPAIDPGAIWRPLPEAYRQPGMSPTQIILHTIVGSAEGAFSFFRDRSDLESTYIVPFLGPRWQLIPLDHSADANRKANRRPDGTGAVSIETEDMGAATVERTPWTTHQVDEIVGACVYVCRTYSIPPRLCRTPSDPGIGYHTLFGAPSDWTPVAKSCPGAARKAQVPEIIERVRLELAGPATPPETGVQPMKVIRHTTGEVMLYDGVLRVPLNYGPTHTDNLERINTYAFLCGGITDMSDAAAPAGETSAEAIRRRKLSADLLTTTRVAR